MLTRRVTVGNVPSDPNSLKDLIISYHSETNINEEELATSIDNFQEIMKCFICLNNVRDPVLCPSCSKFACESCLKNWIIDRKPECPVCRRPLGLSQYVKVRFLNDLSRILDEIGRHQNIRSLSNADHYDPMEHCEEHKIKLSHYCVTCSKSICADCVMFTKNHEKHQFERMKSILEKKVESISAGLVHLRTRINEFSEYSKELTSRFEELKKAKEEKIDELMGAYRTTKSKLDSDFTTRSQQINEEKSRVEASILSLEEAHAEILNQVKNGSPIRIITRNSDYQKIISDLISQSFKPSIPKNIVSDLGQEIIIKPATATFVLKNFSTLKANNEIVFSDPLVADGITWRVKVYPNGTGIYKGMYLSVFIEMVKGWEGGGSYYYKVVLIKANNDGENIERDYTSEYENSICWGYNRFCKLEDLETQGYWDKTRDEIVLKYLVRPSNHFQKVKDLSCYVAYMEEQLKQERLIGLRKASASETPRELPFQKLVDSSPSKGKQTENAELENDSIQVSKPFTFLNSTIRKDNPSVVFQKSDPKDGEKEKPEEKPKERQEEESSSDKNDADSQPQPEKSAGSGDE